MSSQIFLKLPHKADFYTKTTTTNTAGQRTYEYTLAGTKKVFFQSMSSERRTVPYIDNVDEMQIYISYIDKNLIGYENRIQNIVDRFGNVIEAGPLEIVNIIYQLGFTGKIRQILVTARKVVENA
jgi:hypothetical protein